VEEILKEEEIDIVEEMVRARIQARGRRNFEAGDEIREELKRKVRRKRGGGGEGGFLEELCRVVVRG
jgi:hypothetical protein